MKIPDKPLFADRWYDTPRIAELRQEIQNLYRLLTPFRGVSYRIVTGTVTGLAQGVYKDPGLAGTLDPTTSVGAGPAQIAPMGIRNDSEDTRTCLAIATADVKGTANKQMGVKIALNGVPIDATECRGYSTPTTSIKLHSAYILTLEPGDEISYHLANFTNTDNIEMERGRIVVFGIR
jgi:hypothetical protein